MTLSDALKAAYEMMNRAEKVRKARRLENMFPGADRTLRFRSGGQDYLFARMPDGKVLAALNGRRLEKPPKAVLRLARHLMSQADVQDVHGL